MKQDFRSFFVLTIQCLRWVLLLPLAIIALPLATNAQDASLESDLMECIRSSFSNREGLLDSLMTTFESELVAEGLMESRDSEEYRGLLQRIASDQPILRGMDSYFFTRFRNLVPDTVAILSCVETMEQYVNMYPDHHLGQTLLLRAELIEENVTPSLQASAFLDILEVSDLEVPIYRFLTYHIIDGQAYETAILPPSTTDLRQGVEVNGANLFQVLMNEAGQLIVSDQLISPEELLSQVQRHARDFEDQAVYVVEIEDDVKYASFITLKDQIALAITQVRDDYARRYLGKTLTELNTEERSAVFEIYPMEIIAPVN